MKPGLPKVILFGIIGALVGYFIFPYITPITSFAKQETDMLYLRIINKVLGASLGIYLARLKNIYPFLAGILLTSFVANLVAPILGTYAANYLWYSVFNIPKDSLLIVRTIAAAIWAVVVLWVARRLTRFT